MDGRVGGWVSEWMGVWVDGIWVGEWVDGSIGGWMNVSGWMESGSVGRWLAWMGGWERALNGEWMGKVFPLQLHILSFVGS